jgi:hypothetical protein
VGVFDFGETSGLYFFVMEFVDGVNLRQMLRAGDLAPREALAIVPQICEALQYAHDEGIVHRDVKPENILVDKRGRVKIADFGLAKLLGQAQADFTLTRTQQVMGTPQYMAPEQIETPQQVDHRADIYSLGVVFYEMLTGELPIGRFEPPSHRVEVDVRLDDVVLKTLEKRPERRYQHASEVKTEVVSITSGAAPMPQTLPSAPATGPLPAGFANHLLLFVTMFVVGAASIVYGLVGAVMAVVNYPVASHGFWGGLGGGFGFLFGGAVSWLVAWRNFHRLAGTHDQLMARPVAAWDRPDAVRNRTEHPKSGRQNQSDLKNDALIAREDAPISQRRHAMADSTSAPKAVQNRVRVPAMGLLYVGIMDCVAAVLLIGLFRAGPVELLLLPNVFVLAAGLLIILGAINLRSVQSRGLALAGATLAVIPCTPAFPLSLPFGVWALVVLRQSNVKKAFERSGLNPVEQIGRPAMGLTSPPSPTARPLYCCFSCCARSKQVRSRKTKQPWHRERCCSGPRSSRWEWRGQ